MDTLAGMSPAMRKLVRRGMSPKEGDPIKQPKELSPEQLSPAEERNAARIMRRKVAEFWSKQPHGFTSQDLYCVRTINLHSCSLNDDDGEALASVFTKDMVQLKQLDLFGNRFHDTTMAALAAAFVRGAAPLVTHLLLGRNAISDVGLAVGGHAEQRRAAAHAEALARAQSHRPRRRHRPCRGGHRRRSWREQPPILEPVG